MAGVGPTARAGRAGGPRFCHSGSSALDAMGERDDGAERSDLLESVARWMQLSSLFGIVLVDSPCFALGASSGPPTAESALAQSAGAAEQMSLTVLEQRAHQALYVEASRRPPFPVPSHTRRTGLGFC